MATLRSAQTPTSNLPPKIAAGPDPAVWAVGHGDLGRLSSATVAWSTAGDAWAAERGMGHREWRSKLATDVRYAVSALGRAHHLHGGLVRPWDSPKVKPAPRARRVSRTDP